jgi:hypothetical protein
MYQVLEQGEVTIHGWEDAAETRIRIAAMAGLD